MQSNAYNAIKGSCNANVRKTSKALNQWKQPLKEQFEM